MNRSTVRFSCVLAIAISALLVTAAPASAAKFHGTGIYSSFQWGVSQSGGIVAIDRTDTNTPRLRVGLVHMPPTEQVTLNFRSIGCGGNPGPGNLVFRVRTMTDANGDVFLTKTVSASLNFEEIKGIWISGEPPVCSPATSWKVEEGEDVVGATSGNDGALAAMTGEGQVLGNLLLLVEKRPNDRARLSIVVNGLGGNDDLRLRLADKPCGRSPKNSYTLRLQDIPISTFQRRTIDLSQDELDSLRSLSVKNMSTNASTCSPLSLIIVVA